jgi:hypothetical protein
MNKFVEAGDPKTDPTRLAELMFDRDWYIRASVASNSSTPLETLTELAFDQSWNVRSNVAANPSAPRKALEILLLDLEMHDSVITSLLKRNKKKQ